MSLTLYDLTRMQRCVLDGMFAVDEETGEVFAGAEGAEALGEALADKVDACACYLKEIEAEADAIRAEEERLAGRRRALRARAERFRDYMAICMQNARERRVETPRAVVSLRRTRAVEVYDFDALPEQFVNVKTETKPDRRAIGDAIKAGREVPGARTIERDSLSVR